MPNASKGLRVDTVIDSRSGLLVLDKPAGLSSHAAVRRVRKLLGVGKAGHAGTLDPFASGVLLVGLGSATRLLEYLVGHSKSYRATIRLGELWDTHDRTGRLLETRDVSNLSFQEINAAVGKFKGVSFQVPPVYSAIKVNGTPLYRRVRSGEEVAPPPPRRVEISTLNVLDVSLPELTLEMDCSKGTYVRALARDLGASLGCGGVLKDLVRLRSGPFFLSEALGLDEIESLGSATWNRVLSPDRMVGEMPKILVSKDDVKALSFGRSISVSLGTGVPDETFAVVDDAGVLVAVATVNERMLAPKKVFLNLS